MQKITSAVWAVPPDGRHKPLRTTLIQNFQRPLCLHFCYHQLDAANGIGQERIDGNAVFIFQPAIDVLLLQIAHHDVRFYVVFKTL